MKQRAENKIHLGYGYTGTKRACCGKLALTLKRTLDKNEVTCKMCLIVMNAKKHKTLSNKIHYELYPLHGACGRNTQYLEISHLSEVTCKTCIRVMRRSNI